MNLPNPFVGCPYLFQVVEHGGDLLYPFDNLLRHVGVLGFPSHLLVEGHLPAHGGGILTLQGKWGHSQSVGHLKDQHSHAQPHLYLNEVFKTSLYPQILVE